MTSAILGYTVVKYQDGSLEEGPYPLRTEYIDAVRKTIEYLDECRAYYEEHPSEFRSAWEYSGEEADWQSSVDHWYREMKERAYRGERVDFSDDSCVYLQEITGPPGAAESPGGDLSRQMIGYVTFIVDAGNIAYDDLDVMTRKKDVIEHALDVIQGRYDDDSRANPDHPEYAETKVLYPDTTGPDYDEMRDAACRLHRVDLDDDESLFIMEVYAYRRRWRPFRRVFRFLTGLFKR